MIILISQNILILTKYFVGYVHSYYNYLIESGNTQEVKRFFDTFPHLLKDFNSPNKWNPFLYAARYGNI